MKTPGNNSLAFRFEKATQNSSLLRVTNGMFSPVYRVRVLFAGQFSTRRDQVGANLRFTLTMERPSRRDPLVGSASWRDLLVRSDAQHWIIHSASAGVTGTPLRTGTTSMPLRFARRGHLTDKRYPHTGIPGRSQPICDSARMVLIRSTGERERHPFFASARVRGASRVSTPLPW